MKFSPSLKNALTSALIIGVVLTAGVAAAQAKKGETEIKNRDRGASHERRANKSEVRGPGYLFAKLDTNRDGVLSSEETSNVSSEQLARLDSDGDGAITKKEARLFHKAKMKERAEARKEERTRSESTDEDSKEERPEFTREKREERQGVAVEKREERQGVAAEKREERQGVAAEKRASARQKAEKMRKNRGPQSQE